ncbi:MAG: DUF3466 family protein [Opitutaceae bacterium]|jgi:hypothetical protein|nr:DUF3466 family protein [Opitutaceae bacterium]
MMAIMMAFMMTGTVSRAGASTDININTFTLAPDPYGNFKFNDGYAFTGNITNNGYVAMSWVDGVVHVGYWNTIKGTIINHYFFNFAEFSNNIDILVNSNGIVTASLASLSNSTIVVRADGSVFSPEDGRKVRAVNDSGIAVGSRYYSNHFAVIWEENGAATDLPHPDGYSVINSYAVRINNNGLIAGTLWQSESASRAVMWDADADRTPVLLPPLLLEGTTESTSHNVTAINDAGLIAGTASNHAVVWDTSRESITVTDLHTVAAGCLSEGETLTSSNTYGINEAGIIAGSIYINGVGDQGVLWIPGEEGYEMININKLAAKAALLVDGMQDEGLGSITHITGINDLNQIVGVGKYHYLIFEWGGDDDEIINTYHEYREQGFLMSLGGLSAAVPEPGACAWVAGLAAMLAWAARRQRWSR